MMIRLLAFLGYITTSLGIYYNGTQFELHGLGPALGWFGSCVIMHVVVESSFAYLTHQLDEDDRFFRRSRR